MWMNSYDIEVAAARFRTHPVLGPATQTLRNLMDCAEKNSDGWPYWQKPARAATKLMDLIEPRLHASFQHPEVTAADVRKAYVPIKAFLTRNGLKDKCTIVEPA